jgi:hypothetical protein
VAALAAAAATVGDLLLLWAGNAARPELALPRPPAGAVWVGMWLGTLAIPLYAVGYAEVAAALRPAGGRQAGALLLLGTYGAALGGTIHALTGLLLARSEPAASDPLALLAAHGGLLLPLWALVGATLCAGSVVYARTILRGAAPYPRWMALANPAALTVALAVVALPSPRLRAFLLPAAPNVAHVLFFALAGARGGTRDR